MLYSTSQEIILHGTSQLSRCLILLIIIHEGSAEFQQGMSMRS